MNHVHTMPQCEEDHHTLTLRPLPSSPWITPRPELGYSVLDLRGLLPDGACIRKIDLNGQALLFKQAAVMRAEPHLISAAYFPPEAQRLTVSYTEGPGRPLRGSPRPDHGSGNTKVAGRPIDAPRAPDLRQGLLPRGAA